MKNKFIILGIFISYSFCQENRLFWDGRDWNRVTKIMEYNPENTYRLKKTYLDGALDGWLFGYLKTWAKDNKMADDIFGETVDYLNTRELVRGLDNFYTDPLNSYIPVPSAIIIVNMYAERIPLLLIDEYVSFTRKWINDLMLNLDTLNYSKLLEDKFIKHHSKRFNQSE
tara:strand:- start:326 stop:835 length:510 start_codon:yes stop_codon:yes gene_type:complete